MIWVSWKQLVGRIRSSLLLSKVDSIIQSIPFLTLNMCLEVFLFFPVIAGNRHRGLLPECLLTEGIIIPGHMLPPDVAQSDLLDSIPTGTGSVNAWISVQVPWPPALLTQAVLLTKADDHHLSWECLVVIFGEILPTHSIPVFPLLFCCLCSAHFKARKILCLGICTQT